MPREKSLTDDEKKLFTYFVKVPGMREQLISALCDVQMAAADETSKTGNVIVMGGKESGKTRLIASLIPAICKELVAGFQGGLCVCRPAERDGYYESDWQA